MKAHKNLFFTPLLAFFLTAPSFGQDSLNVRLLSSLGHVWFEDVEIVGNYAYGSGSGFLVMDVSNPAHPTEVGRCNTPTGRVAVSGSYAYVAAYDGGLRVVNISNPSTPFEVGFYDTPGIANDVAVAGNYAYIADYGGGLRVINISNPSNPVEVGFFLPEYGTCTYGVAVSGNYAYVSGESNNLWVIDVSNPANPFEVGFYQSEETDWFVYGVAVSGSYAYVVGDERVLRVIDVSNPGNLFEVGSCGIAGRGWKVVISGRYAYVAAEGSLRVIDVWNPSSPAEVGFHSTYCTGVALSGNHAYLAAQSSGLRAVDISNPSSPFEVGWYATPQSVFGVAVSGNYAYVGGDGLWAITVSDPSKPTVAGMCGLPSSNALCVAVAGSYAYVADGEPGLRVVNIANPQAPFETGFYDTPGYAQGVVVSGNYAYVADLTGDLRVINVSNPSSPYEAGFCSFPGAALAVAVFGSYAYVAAYDGGLRVIDVSNPSSPTEVGACGIPSYAFDVAVSGGYAYVAAYNAGLRVVDISNPSSPFEVGSYAAYAYAVAVSGHYVYVTSAWDGPFWVINVSDPGNPYEAGHYAPSGAGWDVAVSGNCAYVANSSHLRIYDCSQAIGCGLPARGDVQVIQFGPPDWGYRLVHQQGCLERLVFTRFCRGTTGRVSGAAAANWNMLAGGDGNNGDSIIFVTTVPLTTGSVDTFWLSHPYCVDVVRWCAGDTCGNIDGPLPVELLSFSAVGGDGEVMLRWETASETGTDRFEIERDGVLVHREAAAGDATGHSYSWIDRGVTNGQTYHYALWSVETNGERSLLRETDATPRAGIVTVTEYALHGNYPNPFNPATEIVYDLPEAGTVSLRVFDLMGREVAVLVNGERSAGQHTISFDARDLPSGMYICRMTANGFTATHKMMLIR